jgi:purine-binding chemotaxis protein CheW
LLAALQGRTWTADEADVEQVAEQVEVTGYPTGVVVRFGGARYAVDMACVAEVVQVPPTSRVPGCPRWLAGVVNWRGRVLPVVDPRSLLGAEPLPLPSSARLLVLSVDGVEAGLVVEAVAGLLEAGDQTPALAPATASSTATSLVLGVVADASGPLSLLDAHALLRLRAELPSARR